MATRSRSSETGQGAEAIYEEAFCRSSNFVVVDRLAGGDEAGNNESPTLSPSARPTSCAGSSSTGHRDHDLPAAGYGSRRARDDPHRGAVVGVVRVVLWLSRMFLFVSQSPNICVNAGSKLWRPEHRRSPSDREPGKLDGFGLARWIRKKAA